MRYGIKKLTLDSPELIALTKLEYETTKSFQEMLFEVLYIEDVYDLLIENYVEYEIETISTAARYLFFQNQDYIWFQDERNIISRRIVNLLSSSRMYLDQSIHRLSNIYKEDTSIVEEVRAVRSSQYDGLLGYRTMEALRNYVQHRGFPFHSVTYHSRVVDRDTSDKVLVAFTPFIKILELEEDEKFKNSILLELKKAGGKVDLKLLIREYIEGISKIHIKLRELLSEDISKWDNNIQSTIQKFEQTYPEYTLTGLAIIKETEKDEIEEEIMIINGIIERREKLEKKNRSLNNLTSRYLSNEIIETND